MVRAGSKNPKREFLLEYGSTDAVANAALFFASDECEWTTGTILNVDGGYGAQGVSYDPEEINH